MQNVFFRIFRFYLPLETYISRDYASLDKVRRQTSFYNILRMSAGFPDPIIVLRWPYSFVPFCFIGYFFAFL